MSTEPSSEPISNRDVTNEITVQLVKELSNIEEWIISIGKFAFPSILTCGSGILIVLSFVVPNANNCAASMATNYTNTSAFEIDGSPMPSNLVNMWCNLTYDNPYAAQVTSVINMVFSVASIAFMFLYSKKDRIFKANNKILISSSESLIKENCHLKNTNETLSTQIETLSTQFGVSAVPSRLNTARSLYEPSTTSTAFPSPINI